MKTLKGAKVYIKGEPVGTVESLSIEPSLEVVAVPATIGPRQDEIEFTLEPGARERMWLLAWQPDQTH
jgi:hypothetical protein